jgi:hypothetical protein
VIKGRHAHFRWLELQLCAVSNHSSANFILLVFVVTHRQQQQQQQQSIHPSTSYHECVLGPTTFGGADDSLPNGAMASARLLDAKGRFVVVVVFVGIVQQQILDGLVRTPFANATANDQNDHGWYAVGDW